MAIRYLLDTNVFSELARDQPNANLVRLLSTNFAYCATASLVVHELHYGLERMPYGKKRRRVHEIYSMALGEHGTDVLPYDLEAAHWHAQERARLEAVGVVGEFVDGQIAAIAATNGLILVTRNTRHFQHYKDVALENWFATHTH